jgi:hypothetical protein
MIIDLLITSGIIALVAVPLFYVIRDEIKR